MAVNRVVLQHMTMNLLEEFPGYDLDGVLPEQRQEEEEEEDNYGDDSPNIQVQWMTKIQTGSAFGHMGCIPISALYWSHLSVIRMH